MSELNPYADERWFQVLSEAVETTSMTDVARQLEYGRSTVSMIMSGKYQAGTARFAEKVMACFTEEVQCPHLGQPLSKAICRDHQSRGMPTSEPAALRHWIACRSGCPHSYHQLDDEVRNA